MAAGVVVATAVLVGALVVGESVRGSLRGLVEERLGRVQTSLTPGRFFGAGLADLPDAIGAAPLIVAPASIGARSDGESRLASGVTLIGCDERFFSLGEFPIGGEARGGAVLTEAVATELGVKEGDSIVLRAGLASALPADSPLGEKLDTIGSTRVKVAAVAPPRGLARFSLTPTQAPPRNVFLPLAAAQRLVGAEGKANTLLAAAAPEEVAGALSPRLVDYGLQLGEVRPGVWQLEAEQLVLPAAVVEAARSAWSGHPIAEATTYLANTIRLGDRSIPYSTVTGVDGAASLVPVAGLADGEVALSSWAAEDLGAKVGDRVTLTYYEPESTHGVLSEAAPVTLRVAQIAPLEGPDGAPTAVNDPRWTPELEGVTDAESINNWDLPFELVEPIRDADEDYWDQYGPTPKAFVALDLAQRLWGSRWGQTSLLRTAAPEASRDGLAEALLRAIDPADLGFAPVAIRSASLRAASGNTPFDVLFLLFSVFLIGSSLLLIALLVWLAIDNRRRELGVLGAVGFDRSAVRRVLLRELAPVAGVGAIVGAGIGVLYAAAMLYLLRTVWVAAVGAPFLRLHVGAASLAGGAFAAWLVALGAIWLAVRRATKAPPRVLLAAGGDQRPPHGGRHAAWSGGAALACLALAGVATMAGGRQQGEAAAGAFFGGGALALAGLLCGIYYLNQNGFKRSGAAGREGLTLSRLARLNLRRRPGRSLLTVGLIASASFLLLATSAFRLPPTEEGVGGFDLIVSTDQPIYYDLATDDGRWELGFGAKQSELLADARVYAMRVEPGEDASCRNLFQPRQPRVLGVTERFREEAADSPTPFAWAENAAEDRAAPWSCLDAAVADAVPVVLDFNTAVYSLKLYGGVGSRFTVNDGAGAAVTLEVVGLLKNSVLQGDVLMREADFLRLYPSASGFRLFFVDAPGGADQLAAVIEDVLADYGADAVDARRRLAELLAVQNTYLSTFQALGGLGLVLGAVGLAVAQFRNLLERRGELALMRAGGFPRRRLRRLVLMENLTLLGLGLACGAAAAAATLAPLSAAEGARPPWLTVALLIGFTLAVGLVAARLAARRALAAPLTAALRGE
ncbi:ABC transporter permease [Botrimarina sp.]|uniref:ABC transporter permease n=1 Tax=Botrimarina sp. TaxID=2795802 RepID=UPI0032ECEE34